MRGQWVEPYSQGSSPSRSTVFWSSLPAWSRARTINRTGLVNLGYGEHGIYLKCRNSEVAENTITNWEHGDGISQRYGNGRLIGNTISNPGKPAGSAGIGIAFFPYESEHLSSEWIDNTISDVDTGMYAPLHDSGSPAPGGTTLENFIIEKNTIGPLTGGTGKYTNLESKGTIAIKENTLR